LLAFRAWQGLTRPRRKFVPPGFRASLVQPVPRELMLRLRFALPYGTRQQLIERNVPMKDSTNADRARPDILNALRLCREQLSLYVADGQQSPEDKEALDAAQAAIQAFGATSAQDEANPSSREQTEPKPNSNCLQDIKCPKCGQEDAFYIDCAVRAYVTDDGAEAANGSFSWDRDSLIDCVECEHTGSVAEFTIPVAVGSDSEVQPLVQAGNSHQSVMDALKAAERAIEEATNVMFSGEDGKPVKRLKATDIEHIYLTLCGVMVQVHEAVSAGESV
jgi:DNA-directed RNA polymerase subunit M/transcription elongation factor TFIIS